MPQDRVGQTTDPQTDLKRDSESAKVADTTKIKGSGLDDASTYPQLNLAKALIPAIIILVALGLGIYFYLHRTPKTSNKDSLIRSGHSVFEATVPEGVKLK